VYFQNEGEFPEVLEFLKEESNRFVLWTGRVDSQTETQSSMCVCMNAQCRYSMDISYLGPFQKGIQQLVDEDGIRGIFIGTRYSDPNAGMLPNSHSSLVVSDTQRKTDG
jgi:hypothetical protein